MGLFPCKSKRPEESEDNESRRPYGRTPDQDPYLSKYSFVHWKVCKEYLKCDIKPWRKPAAASNRNVDNDGDTISFDYLPTDFFDRDCPYTERRMRRRRQSYFQMEGETYRRVVGYREIMMKREYLKYLRNLRKSKEDNVEDNQNMSWKLARGGGGGPQKAHVQSKPTKNLSASSSSTSISKKPRAGGASKPQAPANTKKQPTANKPAATAVKRKRKKKKQGFLSKFLSFKWLLGSNHTPTRDELRSNVLKHQAVKKWKWPNKRKRFPVPPSDPPGKYVVLLHRLYRLPKENEERDNEWLYLSSTSESDDPEVVTHFEKEFHNWMTPGISFESQKLFRQLALMWTLMDLSGRNFLHRRNNFFRGHLEYSSTKGHMIPFFITTILLWTLLCTSAISWFDIISEANSNPDKEKTPFLQVEQTEINKYWVPYCAVVIGNLILVAIWSLAVLLGDGSLIAHYMNCWCAALHEMETSGALDIRQITCKNIQIFILMSGAYVIMFIFNWPGLVRGSCILTSMLFLRPVLPLLRINQPKKLLIYEFTGLAIQLFILFCARLIMCFLQIFALMLRNVSEMWNFKFSLRFKMLAKENRGQLYQLELNHSLQKLWSHHRLIVLLLEEYGVVFCVGIMCYIIPQVGIFAVVMVKMIVNEAGVRRTFYGNDTTIKIYSDELPTIYIQYFHTALEEVFMAAVIFIHIAIDFFYTTDTLVGATRAFMTGAEFVRRAGIMTCTKSHERRLIFSLQWSFSPTRLHALTANRFFTLDRQSLVKFFSIVILIFTLLIRLHTHETPIKVTFPVKGSCNANLGQTLIHGTCIIGMEPPTTPRPPLPPADIYFFMEHCEEIEKKYLNFTASFEYYSDNSSGKLEVANKPPFQICRVRIKNGTSLAVQLEKLGRYFQDHGNPHLQETLQIYFKRLVLDPVKMDYGNITGATLPSHLDSTGGGYCGPDWGGQVGQKCEWVEYYRDCMVTCYSITLKIRLLLPKMWKKTGKGFVLYNDYSKQDCGINPFGFQWKGDSFSPVDPAYDCFGRVVSAQSFDHCGSIPVKEPVSPFTPAVGDKMRLYRSYESNWREVTTKTVTPSNYAWDTTTVYCDKCYDFQSSKKRCSLPALVWNNCPYSRYWGIQASQKGFYLAEQCLQLDIDRLGVLKPTGFCESYFMEGAVLAGHVVNKTTYSRTWKTHWEKDWDLGNGDVPPCEQLKTETLRPIMDQLYFKHACLILPNNKPGSCNPPKNFYFTAYRPYEIRNCKLRQIPLNYETIGGNAQICNTKNRTMILPPAGRPLNLTLRLGKTREYKKFYGCHGKSLLPSTSGYTCVGPILGGVCEVHDEQGYLLFWDCKNAEVLGSTNAVIGQPDDKIFGLCKAHIDHGTPAFKDLKRKVVKPDLREMISDRLSWASGDPWKTPIKILTKIPLFILSIAVCDPRFFTMFCGSNSVALHYPFDGRDSVASGDMFECNWEAYWRDCLQPYHTAGIAPPATTTKVNWMYLPKWVNKASLLQPAKQRKMHPILNVFSASGQMVGCDGRKLPEDGKGMIDSYWRDDCGWVMTPEFVDGDPKGIAVMPPILPIRHQVYAKDGKMTRNLLLHCFQTELALYRCTHPNIFPICQHSLSTWEPSRDVIDYTCFRFNTSCFTEFSKPPNGSSIKPTHPDGFCRGYCPKADTLTEQDLLHETMIDTWRNVHKLSFSEPPCKNRLAAPSLFRDPQNPRDIEHRLFFEFHCSDKTSGTIRDYLSITSGSFHLPMYMDEKTNAYRFVPLQPLLDHLTGKYGPSCDYGGRGNEDNIYPQFAVLRDSATGQVVVNVSRENFLGCHGLPLVWLQGVKNKYPQDTNVLGITDVLRDYPLVCYGRFMGGWCEVDSRPFYFLREDFQVTCDGSQGILPTTCPQECTSMQGHFSKNPLSKEIEDVPGGEYWPFVKSKRNILLSKNNNTSSGGAITPPRTDFPFRRFTTAQFEEVKRKWSMFQDPTKHVEYIQEFQNLLQGPDELHCFHSDPAKLKKYCSWPLYVQQCYVPCKLVYPQRIVTRVSQSLVTRYPGQGDMFLRPLQFISRIGTNGATTVEPAFSFADCAVDPSQYFRQNTMGCNLELLTEHDHFKWANLIEFFPDYANQVVDPVTGFKWIPWALDIPKKAQFTFELLRDYVNPTVTYATSTVPSTQKYQVSHDIFVSPYLACHRVTHEDMRTQILTGIETYWNNTVITRLQMTPTHFSYFPNSASALDKTCQETAVIAYVYWEACLFWNIPSKVLRIYGFCKVIFPAVVVNGAYAALSENVTYHPPQGCIDKGTDLQTFTSIYDTSTGFGLKYSMAHVYSQWNSLCHSCAYTREQHQSNIPRSWCGWGRDRDPGCLSRMESHHKYLRPALIGEGVFKKWNNEVQEFGVLWKLAVEYSCWSTSKNRWQFHSRWETYHPWSLRRESNDVAVYPIHIAMNALACPFPCRGPDETEDCNSKCPHNLHNPCDNEWNGNFFHFDTTPSSSPTPVVIGLNYTVTLKESGKLCQAQLRGLNENPQGLGIFGSYGTNFIQCPGQQCLSDREGSNVYLATSERILLNDDFNVPRGSNKTSEIVYREIIVSRAGVDGPRQAVITDAGEAPRLSVVHPEYHENYTGPTYSTLCASLKNDKCRIVDMKFLSQLTPQYWPSTEKYLYCNYSAIPPDFITYYYAGCSYPADFDVVHAVLFTDPTASWPLQGYCCIPHQSERTTCGPTSNVSQTAVDLWTEKYWASARDSWVKCEDVLDAQGKSVFGWPFPWNKLARYLKGCDFNDCVGNSKNCQHHLRTYKPWSDSDLCHRQFDPEETFIQNPLPDCNLPVPPF